MKSGKVCHENSKVKKKITEFGHHFVIYNLVNVQANFPQLKTFVKNSFENR